MCRQLLKSFVYDNEHLHLQIYNKIADHFSGTRHSPWPIISKFLNDLPEGSMVLDIGNTLKSKTFKMIW